MYLSFDDYVEYGGTLEEATFNQLEFEARAIIDWWTFNRLQKETEFPEAVKRCIFKLVSLLADKQKAMVVDSQDAGGSVQAGIASQSNDGVSVSYNTLSANDAVNTIKNETEATIKMYLTGVKNSLGHKLLYRGLYPNE